MASVIESVFQQLSIENERDNFVLEIPTLDDFYKDIENFNQYVHRYGGHTGGWSSSDHNIYLQLRGKHNLHNVIRLIQKEFPDISEMDVVKHDNWFNKYLKLKNNQQRALKFWRLQRCTCNTPQSERTTTSVISDSTEQSNQLLERTKVKQKIQKWKEELKRRKENEEKIKQIMKRDKKEKEAIYRQKWKEKSSIIKDYKEEMINLQYAVKLAEEVEMQKQQKLTAKKANTMILQFREKDALITMRKRVKELNEMVKKEGQKFKIQFLSQKYKKLVSVNRDPSRIFQPTKEWENKFKKLSSSNENPINDFKPYMCLETIKRLGVPEWRKNVTCDQ